MMASIKNRGITLVATVLACVTCIIAPQSLATALVVPLISHHHYWDHHWYVWLPRHPTYEAVEVMSIDSPDNPFEAVWVLFTEREGTKRQLHFFNDRRIVESVEGSHYRDITYQRTGKAGLGQNVRVALTGLDEAKIEIIVGVGDSPLTRIGAGLTDQSRHSANRLFLLFHRDRNALATTNTVLIDGYDFSFRPGDDPEGRHRFAAAYSAGIQIALVPFRRWSFAASGTRLVDDTSGLAFAVESRGRATALVADLPGYRNRVTIVLDANGALENYRHDTGAHRMFISLDTALPLDGRAPQSASAFTIHLDPDAPVAHGRVLSEPAVAGRRLSWRFVSPNWAIDYPFESIIETRNGEFTLKTQTQRTR